MKIKNNFFPPEIKRKGRELPNHPYQIPGLRMSLDISPRPHTVPWRTQRQFYFTFIINIIII